MKKRTLKAIVCAAVTALTLAVTACGSKTKTVEDYYNQPAVKAVFEEEIKSVEGQGMSVSIDVKGNDFTMIYKYDAGTELPENAGELLEAALDENASVFEEQAAGIDEAISQTGACTVIVRYLDADDNLLAEKSFKGNK